MTESCSCGERGCLQTVIFAAGVAVALAASAQAARFDAGRLLVEEGPSKALRVEDNIAWLEAGKVPDYAVGNVIRWLELKGRDVSALRARYRPQEPALGKPLAEREGFRLGYMLDISRDKVPTLETLKRIADILSVLGYNDFQLYTECTFAYRGLENAWREWSPMTPEETRELSAYCGSKGVRLVPNQNSLGHLERLFAHPEFRRYAETPNGYDLENPPLKNRPPCVLCPTDPATYSFLDSLYDQLLPNFRDVTEINVGCDEAWDIFASNGRSAAKARQVGVARVYMDHLLELHRRLKRRGVAVSFWADMVLYEPTLLGEIPKDAIPLQWGYSCEERTPGYTCEFEGRCEALRRQGLPYRVCPATGTFGKWRANMTYMRGNVRLAVTAGRKFDAKGVLLTSWGDGGHRAPYYEELPGLVYAAAQVRGEDPSEKEVASRARELAALMPGCREVGEATLALADEMAKARADGTFAARRGGFATQYGELWLRHNRFGGLVNSMQCLELVPKGD